MAELIELPRFKGRAGWEFTDISKLDLAAYERELPGDEAPADALFAALPVAGELPRGVTIGSLEDAPADVVGSLLRTQDDVFVELCEAGPRRGTFVHIAAGTVVEQPLLVSTVHQRTGTLVNQRTLILVEPGAQVEVWDQFVSAVAEQPQDGVFNVVTELVVRDGARLRYVCGQDLAEKTWIFGAQRARIERDAFLDWVALGFGSARGRVRMETRLAGEGGEARITGAYATHGAQHIDFDTTQEHAAEHTTSDLAFRGVLQDRSSAVWKGNIIVDPGAQKTDAFQESRNLLLSKRSHADAIPGLEIEANDVRCTHAAAIAQIDPEQLFYLRSHGLPEPQARRLVIEGFLAALVERFEAGPVREVLAAALERRLKLILG